MPLAVYWFVAYPQTISLSYNISLFLPSCTLLPISIVFSAKSIYPCLLPVESKATTRPHSLEFGKRVIKSYDQLLEEP